MKGLGLRVKGLGLRVLCCEEPAGLRSGLQGGS